MAKVTRCDVCGTEEALGSPFGSAPVGWFDVVERKTGPDVTWQVCGCACLGRLARRLETAAQAAAGEVR